MTVKPGYRTSEFLLTAITLLVQALVAAGILSVAEGDDVGKLMEQAVGGLLALGALFLYIRSRTQLKLDAGRGGAQ